SYDPASDAWRMIADFPAQPRAGAAAVWTGRELALFGGSATGAVIGSSAAYDPATDRWRPLPPAPASVNAAAAWTGKEILLWGGLVAGARRATLSSTAAGFRFTP
ncbi:MAG: hypothetical protein ACRD0F_08845, partial [Acidimicrobiales bacterium]